MLNFILINRNFSTPCIRFARSTVFRYYPEKTPLLQKITFVLLTLVLSEASANNNVENQYVVQNLSATPRLGNETITKIIQSSDGFLWIGTNQGVIKYSGNKLIRYSPFNTKKHYAPALHISDISESPSGTIWISTADGTLSHHNKLTENFYQHESIKTLDRHASLTSIATNDDNNVWLGTRSGIGLYNRTGNVTSSLTTKSENGHEIGHINDIAITNNGKTIIAAHNGLFITKPSSTINLSSKWHPTVNWLPLDSRNFTFVLPLDSGDVWAATANGEIYKLNHQLEVIDRVEIPEHFTSTSVTALGLLHKELLIGTHDGLIIYNISNEKYLLVNKTTSSISNDHISAIFPTENFAWIGTYKGLNRISKSQFSLFNSLNREIDDEVLTIETDSAQRAWIG